MLNIRDDLMVDEIRSDWLEYSFAEGDRVLYPFHRVYWNTGAAIDISSMYLVGC